MDVLMFGCSFVTFQSFSLAPLPFAEVHIVLYIYFQNYRQKMFSNSLICTSILNSSGPRLSIARSDRQSC